MNNKGSGCVFKFIVKICKLAVSICLCCGFTQIAIAEEQKSEINNLYDVTGEYILGPGINFNDSIYNIDVTDEMFSNWYWFEYEDMDSFKKFYDFTSSIPVTKVDLEIKSIAGTYYPSEMGIESTITFSIEYGPHEEASIYIFIIKTGEVYVSSKNIDGTWILYKEYEIQDYPAFIEQFHKVYVPWQDNRYGSDIPSGYRMLPKEYSDWAWDSLNRGEFQFGSLHGSTGYKEFSGISRLAIDEDYRVPVTREDFSGFLYVTMLNTEIARIEGRQRALGEIYKESDKIAYYSFNAPEFHKGIQKLHTMGIVFGDEQGNLRPKDPITREEAATILDRLYTHFEEIPQNTSVELFADNKEIANWARESVYNMRDLKIINGKENNEFTPKHFVSMEQAVAISFNMFDSLTLNK